jgi:hypothetical protein
MKKTLLILFSLAGIFAQAQTLSMPTIPSAGVTYPVTIKSDTVPHPTQGNWDFSNVTTDATGTIEFEPISSTSYSSSYPNATHVKYEDGGTFFLGFDATEYTFHGEMSVITTSYTNPLVLHTYPFAIGNTSTDSELNISFTCNGCPPSMERDDASYSEALSSGTLTMPDGTVHSNALLVYNTRTWNDGQTGSPTCNLFLEQWQWWVGGYPMPVAQTVELSTTGPCPPNVGYRQSKFLVGNPIGIQEEQTRQVDAYPNPATDRLFLKNLTLGGSEFKIYDLVGKAVQKGTINETSDHISISSLSPGLYYLVLENQHQWIRFIKE